MTLGELVKLSRAPGLVLMAIGVYWGGLAGMMPDIKARVGASDGVMGLVLLAPATASVIAMALVPWAGRKLGGLALPLSAGLIVVAVLAHLVATSVPLLALVLFLGGFTVAFADMTANVRIAEIEVRRDVHLMNFNHALFSVSFGLTALGIALARRGGAGVVDIAPWLAGVAALYVVFGFERGARAAPVEDGASKRAPMDIVLLAGAVLFCGFIGENATEAWSALHIERTLGADAGVGSFGPAMLGAVMAAGRFSGQALSKRLGPERLIIGSAVLGVIGAAVIAAGVSVAMVLIGVVFLGIGVAVSVPSTNSIIARKVTEAARPAAISRAWVIGLLGFFVGPSMMGGLAEIGTLRLSFAAVTLFVALIIPAVVMLSRR